MGVCGKGGLKRPKRQTESEGKKRLAAWLTHRSGGLLLIHFTHMSRAVQ